VVADPRDGRPLRLEVSDTGIGIPASKLGAVFEAFQQADAGTDRKYSGTGLGLTISRALCQLMGHRIEVSSEPGKGSTFSVVLGSVAEGTGVPMAEVPRAAPSQAWSAGPGPVAGATDLRGTQVLVIDDEPDARTLLVELLEEFGCEVLVATSGEQGLRMAREFRPQLITVDLMMPTLQGADVIRAIKGDPELRSIPVVVVSVVAAEHRGGILGEVDLLEKPIQRDELLAVLQRNTTPARPRVLVVEDEGDAQRLMLAQLRDLAAEVDTAANGREALARLQQGAYDLVLLDLMMPVMDGMTFLEALRNDPRHRNLPVVVITAKELTREERMLVQRQAQGVFKKAEVFEKDLRSVLRCARRTPAQPEPPAGRLPAASNRGVAS
jgi:CheY-like chemotaxis protein